jgi:uncharacterized protein with HEPN domain
MCGRRSEAAYVADMVAACERMLVFASGRPTQDILDECLPYRGAILHQLIVLGEAARYITIERRQQWVDIPWQDIVGMRDKLVHYYHGIDDTLVLHALRAAVPRVLPQLREMLVILDREERAGE